MSTPDSVPGPAAGTSDNRSGGIGIIGAAAIGVGGMVGGGIFAVLGTAVMLAGGGTPVAFAVAGVVALLTSYAYVKLSVRYPCAGGTVVFLDRAFGIDLVTGSLNLMLWLSYLVTIALYASAFGSYASTFFPTAQPWLRHVLISAGIVLPAVINILNSGIVSKSETLVVTVKLALLALVVVAGAPYVDLSKVAPSTWEGPLSLVAGGMVIFVAYEGFELIANAGADVRNPRRTLPWAFYSCVGFVIVLYILVAVITVGSVPADVIAASKDYALAEAAKPALGHTGFVIVAIAALMATFSAINATIYGNARLGYCLATDGELPALLDRQTWHRPISGVLVTTTLALLLANLVDLHAIAIMGSAGFLVIFAAVNAAACKLGKRAGANRVITGLAALACVAATVTLLAHTYEDDPHALWIFLAMIAASVAFELIFPRLTGRRLRLNNHADKDGDESEGSVS